MIVTSTENYTVLKTRDSHITELHNELIETLKIRNDLLDFMINPKFIGLLYIDIDSNSKRFYSNIPLFNKAFADVSEGLNYHKDHNTQVYREIIGQAKLVRNSGEKTFTMSIAIRNKKNISRQFICHAELLESKYNKAERVLCKIRNPHEFELEAPEQVMPEIAFKIAMDKSGNVHFLEFDKNFDKHDMGIHANDILADPKVFFYKYIRPENLTKVQASILTAFEYCESIDIEYRIQNTSGAIRYHHMVAHPEIDEESKVWIGSIEDITFSKFKYNEIERLALVAKNTSDIILLCDFAGDVIWTNNLDSDILGYTSAEAIGFSPIHNKIGEDTDQSEIQNFREALNKHVHYQGRIKLYKKTGEPCWLDYHITPVWNDFKEFMYSVVTKRDVTLLMKQQDELQEVLEITSDQNNRLKKFAHVLSHNIRSHVANLVGLMQIINITQREDEKTFYLGKFDNVLSNLESTISRLNDLLSLESQDKTPEIIDLKNAISNEMATVFPNVLKHNIELSHDFLEIKINVWGVRSYLRAIFREVYKNCIQFRNKKERLKVHTKIFIQDNQVVIRISDNGLGIDLNTFGHRVFAMFNIFHPGISGKGLSLYLVKRLVAKMKGQVCIESEARKGTTIEISLPLAPI